MIIVGGGPGGYVRTKLLRQIVTAVADGAMAVHMAEKYMGKCKVNSAFMHRNCLVKLNNETENSHFDRPYLL